MPNPKPTPESVDREAQHLLDLWSPAHARWRDEVDPWVWEDDIPIWGDEEGLRERSRVRNTRAPAIIDHAIDAVADASIKVHREAASRRGRGSKAKRDETEKALAFLLDYCALQDNEVQDRLVSRYLFMYDYAVKGGPFWDTADKPEKPKKRQRETQEEFEKRQRAYDRRLYNWCGVRTRVPHPARVLMDPWAGAQPPRAFVLESYGQRFLHEWSLREKGRGGTVYEMTAEDEYAMVETIEYWDKDWHGLKVKDDSTFIFLKPNLYGFQPWKQVFGSFGGERTNTADKGGDLLTHCRGILWPAIPDLLLQSQETATEHQAGIEASWQRWQTVNPLGASTQMQGQFVDKALQVEPLQIPVIPQWYFEKSAKTDARITDVTYVRDAAGQKQPGVVTVGQQAILWNAVMRKFAAVVKKMSQLDTLIARDILQMVDIGEYVIHIKGVTLDGNTIQGDYNANVERETVDPAIQIQMRNIGMQEHKQRLINGEYYREHILKVEDETGMKLGLLIEDAEADPTVKAKLAAEVLAALGLKVMLTSLQGESTDMAPEPAAAEPTNPLAALGMSEDMAAQGGAAMGGM